MRHLNIGSNIHFFMSLTDIVKKAGSKVGRSIAIPLVAALAYVAPAKAGIITQYAPGYVGSEVELNAQITNNDNGAIYNSYDLSLFYSLALSLFNLPQNQANYSSVGDLTSAWNIGIVPGEVSNGWNANGGNYNPVSLNNIDGDINIDYDGWYATQQRANQDTMTIRVSIPTSQLDSGTDGIADYTIGMNSTPTADMGVGRNGGAEWAAQGYEYNVTPNSVPEPSGRVVQVSTEHGMPVMTITNSPSTATVIVQRCDSMVETNWQSISNLPVGTTNWTDNNAAGNWRQLYYRLAQ